MKPVYEEDFYTERWWAEQAEQPPPIMETKPKPKCTCPWYHTDSECPVHGNP